MKAILKFILLAACLAAGVWLWLVLFPSPEKIIRHRLVKLARNISFSPGEGGLARMAGAESAGGFFATNVEVNIDVPGRVQHSFWGRTEITQAVLASRSALSGLIVKFPDVIVVIMPDQQNATADLTLEATVGGETDIIVQELKVTLQKIDGQWLIMHIETVRTLS